jgi:hypothetical protein
MDSANTFAVVTLISCLYTLPIALVLEGPKLGAGLAAVKAAGWTWAKLAQVMRFKSITLHTPQF